MEQNRISFLGFSNRKIYGYRLIKENVFFLTSTSFKAFCKEANVGVQSFKKILREKKMIEEVYEDKLRNPKIIVNNEKAQRYLKIVLSA